MLIAEVSKEVDNNGGAFSGTGIDLRQIKVMEIIAGNRGCGEIIFPDQITFLWVRRGIYYTGCGAGAFGPYRCR